MSDDKLMGLRSPPPRKLRYGPNASTPLLAGGERGESRLLKSSSTLYFTMSGNNASERSVALATDGSFANSGESVANSFTRSARRPFHYPVNKQFIGRPVLDDQDLDASATYNRQRYYSRLTGNDPEEYDLLRVPDHILPYRFLIPRLPFKRFSVAATDGKQGSVLTIFAIWNMLMGSTLLCLPWALHQAGLYFGLGMMLGMLYLCFYTADLIVKIPQLAHIKCQEFSDACAILLGRWAQTLVAISSLISLLGTCIVYWVLMTNFMYHIVSYVFELVVHNSTVTISMHGTDDVFCDVTPSQNPNFSALSFPSAELADAFDSDSLFYRFWDMQTTAPFALGLILIPIIFIRSPAVFMKFNALGTFSVVLLLAFVVLKGYKWGFLNYSTDENSMWYTPNFNWSFAVQSGVLSQALFIHNCIMTVLQLQRKPQNNSRDLGIAYFLVGLTYFAIALFIYLGFPLAKSCILDNFLDNFQSSDLLAFSARCFMFFQVLCLFPLFCYMLRSQLLHMLFPSNPEPRFCRLSAYNALLAAVCIVFAIYVPKIGTIIRFVGAISGLILVFAFPPIAHLRALQIHYSSSDSRRGGCFLKGIPVGRLIFHIAIVIFGIANCVGQFLVDG